MDKSKDRPKIAEAIVVEGRDDSAAVLAVVDAETIITNGFKLREPVKRRIADAAVNMGIIIFTDPDYAGENIRRAVEDCATRHAESLGKTPRVLHARLVAEDAEKDGDIGVENASPDCILDALEKCGAMGVAMGSESGSKIDMAALDRLGLSGDMGKSGGSAKALRRMAGRELGIGYANAKQFLKRLRSRGVGEEKLANLLEELNRKNKR